MTYEEIFEKYHDRVNYFILGKINDSFVAEDLTSTVFLKVYEKFDTFDDSKASISTWIFTIARNSVIDYYRTTRVFEEVPETLASSEDEIGSELMMQETLSELTDALEKLPERERDLIILHYYHGLTLKAVGEKMKMSYANVKIVHNKALSKLKLYMGE